ncbi:MAG: thioredoxin fold domain-containing protein, partial [Ferruginibacter sp.]|nr:thioredoxin fold domain-containing protein [Ferruginibacter sp.]
AKEMRNNGYQKVYELNGGINAWKAANKPLQGKSTAPQMSMEQFNTSIKKDVVVLVDFGAEWCPPCKKMEPVLKDLQAKNKDFTIVKVDGGKDEEVMKQFGVTALPVFIIFKNGKQAWRKDGVVDEKEIAAALLK